MRYLLRYLMEYLTRLLTGRGWAGNRSKSVGRDRRIVPAGGGSVLPNDLHLEGIRPRWAYLTSSMTCWMT